MPNGICVIDKPQDWTSMDVCAKLRGILKERRIGHAGTLDPMATGVLPVFVGAATKAVEFAGEGDKEYLAGLRLGRTTNTQDSTGETLEEKPVSVTRADLEALLPAFTGPLEQIPPMYSAIKIDGKKLYQLARKGKEVERPPRPITIYSLTLEGMEGSDYLLRVRCSKGTYIRTLCHDMGQALGCGGCMASLRRTAAAGFALDQAVTLEKVQRAADRGEEEALLLPVDRYFLQNGWRESHTLGEKEAGAFRNGRQVPLPKTAKTRLYDPTGEFLALCHQGKVVKRFYGG